MSVVLFLVAVGVAAEFAEKMGGLAERVGAEMSDGFLGVFWAAQGQAPYQ